MSSPGTPLQTQDAAATLVGRLRGGGHVLYFRHAATDQSRQDDPTPDLTDRSTQRNLSERGREQARQIGTAIGALGVPIGEVLISPYARVRETAELAFGTDRLRETSDLLNEAYPGTDDADLARRLQGLLATPPPPGENTVLIGHGFNITEATGLTIAEGECAIFEPTGRGDFRLVARVTVEQWQAVTSR